MKPFWKSKTMWLAIVQAVLGTVLMITTQEIGTTLGLLMVVKSAIDAAMRYITSDSIQ